MRKNAVWLAFLILGLVLCGNAWAQGLPSSTLSGKVINEGQALPGVSVTVKSPALQGTRTAVTSGNGDYAFVALPPGKYAVTFSMTGFQPLTKQADLAASQSSVLNATLSLTAVAAEATVVGRAENISETTQAATTYTSDLLNKLPVARTLASAVALSPGVNGNGPNGATTISGAQSYDNLYLVNGANIMDNIRGTPNNLFIEDAIQETTTTTGGISAEYGRFAGGVINTITKSGGNAFTGSLRTTFDDAAWAAIQPKGSAGIQKLNETYEATLGGPIVKDAVWFFGAGRMAKLDTTYTTQGTLIPVNRNDDEKRYEGKLTVTPLQNQTLTGSYMGIKRAQNNYYFTTYSTYDLASFYDRTLPQDFLVVNYNGVLTSNFFLEGQYSQRHFTFENSGGKFTDLIKGTPILDFSNVAFWNSPVFCAVCPNSTEKRDNKDFFGKATYFLSTPSVGSHNIVLGYDQFKGSRLANNYQSGSQYIAGSDETRFVGQNAYPVFTPDVAYLIYNPILVPSQPTSLKTQSVFLNDTWKLNNMLSFNLGVRWDKNDAIDSIGVRRQDDSAWSPRLGVTFDVKGDGKLRVNASYARYVAAVQENFAGAASPGGTPNYLYYNYGGDPINTGVAPYLSATDALNKFFSYWGITHDNMYPVKNGDGLFLAILQGFNSRLATGMESPHNDEFSVGLGGALGSRATFRTDAVYRKGAGFIEGVTNLSTGKVTDEFGNNYDVRITQNGTSDYKRVYYGLNTQFSWRPTDRLSVGGNWTWSHTYGNFVGETAGSGPVAGTLNSYPEYRQLSWYAPVGNLSQDQRHRVRAFGSYDFPLPKAFGNLGIGGIFQYNSGLPYSAIGTVRVSSYVTNPGYATPPVNNSYYLNGRGAYITEAWYQADLSLNYSYDIGPVQLYIAPQVLNVFNSQHMIGTNVNTTVYTASNKTYLKAFNPFTTAQSSLVSCAAGTSAAAIAACQAAGANWQPGPTFGQGSSALAYQTPRTFRVSVGLRF